MNTDKPPTRVLNIVGKLEYGGMQRYLLRLLEHRDPSRWQFDFLCKSSERGELADQFESLGGSVIVCPQSYFNPLSWWKLLRVMKAGGYDNVSDYTGPMAGIPMLVAGLASIPSRVTWYRNSKVRHKGGVRTLYAAATLALVKLFATDILSNSAAALDRFHPGWGSKPQRYKVIYNGVPRDTFRPDPQAREHLRAELGIAPGTGVIGHIGRFANQKNQSAVIGAAQGLIRRGRDIKVLLIGEGALKQQMQARVESAGLSAHVSFLGLRDDVPALLNAMDLFLFPSLHEGHPNVLVEAMLCQTPFVTSAIPEILACLPPEQHGYTADPSDVARLTELSAERLDDPQPDLLRGARAWCVQQYSMESCFERVTGVISARI